MISRLTIFHALNVDPEIKFEPCAYAPNDTVYFTLDKNSPLSYMRSLYSAEKERNEWIRKYDNLLNGLNYWKDKALSK